MSKTKSAAGTLSLEILLDISPPRQGSIWAGH